MQFIKRTYPLCRVLKALLTLLPWLWPGRHSGAQAFQGINIPARYPFTTPGSREAIVDKMPCLGA